MPPEKFIWLLKQLIERHREDIDKLKRIVKAKKNAKSYDFAIIIRLLNMPVRWGIEVPPLGKVSERRVYDALRKIDSIIDSEEWLRIKSAVWESWGKLVLTHVTNIPEIIRPIFGYAARLKAGDYEKKSREEFHQASIEMALSFLEARKSSIFDLGGVRSLEAHVGGIPIHMLFMLPRVPDEKTFFEKTGARV